MAALDETMEERAHDLLRRSGLETRQVQPAGRGSQHHLFVVELDDGPLRLLRMPREEVSPRISPVLQSEAEAVLRARDALPVPYPVELLPSVHEAEGCLMPVLPGTRASDLRKRGSANADITRICMELGRNLACLHRIRRQPGEPTVIRTILPDLTPEEPCLLHGDAHLGNLLAELEAKKGWKVTGFVDWSFCAWGPPEADLVEMALCEAEPRPHLGRVFYEAYVDAGGLPPREPVFRAALKREIERRLRDHPQAYDPEVRNRWTRWLDGLRRPDAVATRIFDIGRAPGRGLV